MKEKWDWRAAGFFAFGTLSTALWIGMGESWWAMALSGLVMAPGIAWAFRGGWKP